MSRRIHSASARYGYRTAQSIRIRNHGPFRARLTEAQVFALTIRWAEAVRYPATWRGDQLDLVAEALNRTPADVLRCWGIESSAAA